MSINILSDAGNFLDAARKFAYRNGKALSALKQRNAARISRGRPGFPKPLNLPKMGISNRARNINRSMQAAGTGVLQTLLDNNAYAAEVKTQISLSKQIEILAKGVEDKQNALGTNTDTVI